MNISRARPCSVFLKRYFTEITTRFLHKINVTVFHKRRITFRRPDGAVGIVSMVRAGRFLAPTRQDNKFFPSTKRRDRIWGPLSLLFIGYRVSPYGEKHAGRAADHFDPLPKLKMSGGVPQLPLYSFIARIPFTHNVQNFFKLLYQTHYTVHILKKHKRVLKLCR